MHVFITGVSKGLGKALAEHYLNEGNLVTGIGRSHSFKHSNFSFIPCDLSNLEGVKKIEFSSKDDHILLINNAGILGNIQRLSDQEIPDIENVLTVNLLSPMYLCTTLIKQTSATTKVIIVNISSGAANRSIPSWASYCASKAGLDRFSETFLMEEKEKGRQIKMFSVAPGVIDTEMQKKIRESSSDDFSSVDNFIQLKEKGELISPLEAVNKLVKLIQLPDNDKVIWSLRDVN